MSLQCQSQSLYSLWNVCFGRELDVNPLRYNKLLILPTTNNKPRRRKFSFIKKLQRDNFHWTKRFVVNFITTKPITTFNFLLLIYIFQDHYQQFFFIFSIHILQFFFHLHWIVISCSIKYVECIFMGRLFHLQSCERRPHILKRPTLQSIKPE